MATKSKQVSSRGGAGPTVTPSQGIDLIRRLIEKAQALREKPRIDSADTQAWLNLARDYLSRVFGENSPNINSVLHTQGDTGIWVNMSDQDLLNESRSAMKNRITLLESCIEQLQTDIELAASSAESQPVATAPSTALPTNKRVFVVHGHNHGVKEAVARFLDRLGLDPVILHEQPNAGRTIIEKFSDHADVQFAVVLLTGDDEGRARGGSDMALRARQNVVLELGYFLGKLGRARVCALYERGVEIPSDYQGVLFVEHDNSDRWRFELVRELRGAGFDVDANRIFGV